MWSHPISFFCDALKSNAKSQTLISSYISCRRQLLCEEQRKRKHQWRRWPGHGWWMEVGMGASATRQGLQRRYIFDVFIQVQKYISIHIIIFERRCWFHFNGVSILGASAVCVLSNRTILSRNLRRQIPIICWASHAHGARSNFAETVVGL